MSIAYQRVVLHSSFKLNEDIEIFERERISVENLLKQNNIDYIVLIQEERNLNQKGRLMPVEYVLSVFVKMADIDKVIDLFDKDGTLGYYVDLEDKIVSDGPLTEEIIRQVEENRNKEEFEKIQEEEPIQNFDDNSNFDDTEEIEVNLVELMYYGFCLIMFLIILIVEIALIFKTLNQGDYNSDTSVVITAIICEIPIIIGLFNKIRKKKGN